MNEDTKLILEEMAKMEQRLNKRMDNIEAGIAINAKSINALREEMTEEFKAVRYEVQTVHDMLEERIGDLDTVTAQNCKDIILLKTKRA